MTTHPELPFGTHLTLVAGGRHELLTAYVVSSNRTTGGYRYHCVFPYRNTTRWANVYSVEIETVGDVDEAETWRLLRLDKMGETR